MRLCSSASLLLLLLALLPWTARGAPSELWPTIPDFTMTASEQSEFQHIIVSKKLADVPSAMILLIPGTREECAAEATCRKMADEFARVPEAFENHPKRVASDPDKVHYYILNGYDYPATITELKINHLPSIAYVSFGAALKPAVFAAAFDVETGAPLASRTDLWASLIHRMRQSPVTVCLTPESLLTFLDPGPGAGDGVRTRREPVSFLFGVPEAGSMRVLSAARTIARKRPGARFFGMATKSTIRNANMGGYVPSPSEDHNSEPVLLRCELLHVNEGRDESIRPYCELIHTGIPATTDFDAFHKLIEENAPPRVALVDETNYYEMTTNAKRRKVLMAAAPASFAARAELKRVLKTVSETEVGEKFLFGVMDAVRFHDLLQEFIDIDEMSETGELSPGVLPKYFVLDAPTGTFYPDDAGEVRGVRDPVALEAFLSRVQRGLVPIAYVRSSLRGVFRSTTRKATRQLRQGRVPDVLINAATVLGGLGLVLWGLRRAKRKWVAYWTARDMEFMGTVAKKEE